MYNLYSVCMKRLHISLYNWSVSYVYRVSSKTLQHSEIFFCSVRVYVQDRISTIEFSIAKFVQSAHIGEELDERPGGRGSVIESLIDSVDCVST